MIAPVSIKTFEICSNCLPDLFSSPNISKIKALNFNYNLLYNTLAVFISAHGQMDLRGILQSVTKKDYMRYQMYMTEIVNQEMREESFRTGKNTACQMTFIADMANLSMRQMTYKPGELDSFFFSTKKWDLFYPFSSHGNRIGTNENLRVELP